MWIAAAAAFQRATIGAALAVGAPARPVSSVMRESACSRL